MNAVDQDVVHTVDQDVTMGHGAIVASNRIENKSN